MCTVLWFAIRIYCYTLKWDSWLRLYKFDIFMVRALSWFIGCSSINSSTPYIYLCHLHTYQRILFILLIQVFYLGETYEYEGTIRKAHLFKNNIVWDRMCIFFTRQNPRYIVLYLLHVSSINLPSGLRKYKPKIAYASTECNFSKSVYRWETREYKEENFLYILLTTYKFEITTDKCHQLVVSRWVANNVNLTRWNSANRVDWISTRYFLLVYFTIVYMQKYCTIGMYLNIGFITKKMGIL